MAHLFFYSKSKLAISNLPDPAPFETAVFTAFSLSFIDCPIIALNTLSTSIRKVVFKAGGFTAISNSAFYPGSADTLICRLHGFSVFA